MISGFQNLILFLFTFIFTGALSANAFGSLNQKQDLALVKISLLYGMTEQDLARFDAELMEEDFDILRSPSYQRLLAARTLIEAEHHSLSDEYGEETADALLNEAKFNWEEVLLTSPKWWGNSKQGFMSTLVSEVKNQFEIARAELTIPLIQASTRARASNINGRGFSRGTWALTYDDGPSPSRTSRILNLLNRYGYSATFFVLAQNAKAHPKTIRQILSSGMEVANHSYSHPNLAKASQKSLNYQINTSSDVIESITGRKLRYFRLPYGSGQNNSNIMGMLGRRGLTHVGWNVDSLDWRDRNPQSVYERTVRQMQKQGGGVILFHDIHEQTVKASELLMRNMKAGKISGRLMTLSKAL